MKKSFPPATRNDKAQFQPGFSGEKNFDRIASFGLLPEQNFDNIREATKTTNRDGELWGAVIVLTPKKMYFVLQNIMPP